MHGTALAREPAAKLLQHPVCLNQNSPIAIGMLGIVGILVHSAVDFNLEIPANAALFYVFCTVAAAEPMLVPKRKRKPVQPPAEETLSASEVV